MSARNEAWLVLVHAVAAVEGALARPLLAHHGLGLSDFRALDILSRSPRLELRMQDLATHLGLNQSSVSRLVERLGRSQLTIKDLCADDRRGVYTVLTPKGLALHERVLGEYESALEKALQKHGGDRWLLQGPANLLARSAADASLAG